MASITRRWRQSALERGRQGDLLPQPQRNRKICRGRKSEWRGLRVRSAAPTIRVSARYRLGHRARWQALPDVRSAGSANRPDPHYHGAELARAVKKVKAEEIEAE